MAILRRIFSRATWESPFLLVSSAGAPVKISREDVLRVAELAHLELSPEEIDTYRGQLDEILTYIDKLKELDVSAVEPMAQVLFSGPASDGASGDSHPELREDVLRPCEVSDPVLSRAPDAAKPFFRVPKVIER
jgi:aspartyl-tRNA(Asn)/glutamyl-tRNA(Gln) amidotransferase subunit C